MIDQLNQNWVRYCFLVWYNASLSARWFTRLEQKESNSPRTFGKTDWNGWVISPSRFISHQEQRVYPLHSFFLPYCLPLDDHGLGEGGDKGRLGHIPARSGKNSCGLDPHILFVLNSCLEINSNMRIQQCNLKPLD